MKKEFVYNPKDFNGHSHASCLAEHNGDIYLSWYVYEEEEHQKGQVVISKLNQETQEWSKAEFVFTNTRHQSQGNPVIFSHNGKLHLYFVILQGHYWDSAQIYYSCQNEQTKEWEVPTKVNVPNGIMVRHRPLLLGNKLLIPAYDEKDMTTVIYSVDGDMSQWRTVSRTEQKYIQADLLKFNEQECQMYLRDTTESRKVMKAVSSSAGSMWNNISETDLHCPLSGIAAIKLSKEQILVANNHTTEHKRNPLSLSLSKTRGLDFDNQIWHIDKTDIELSYPTLLQDTKNMIHLAYTYNRKMIKHISFTEEELINNLEPIND